MALRFEIFQSINKIRNFSSLKRKFTGGIIVYNKPTVSSPSPQNVDVPGLSDAVLKVPSNPVGPGAAKNSDYKNPEYFCYDKNSYFEAEIEMQKYRCPQPSSKKAK